MLGAIRGISQMISYEMALTVVLLPIILLTSSLNYKDVIYLQNIASWHLFTLLPLSVCFLICALAETNRVPFDLIEAEAELVAGYNVEYGGFLFAFLFISEYASIMLMSLLFVIFFLGGSEL